MIEADEDNNADPSYKRALEKRNRLLGFDKSAVTHSAIKDQGADWYELENNTWESKENRDLAKKMRMMEEQNKEMEENATYISIGGGKGEDFVSIKGGQVKSTEQIAKEANDYINQIAMDRIQNNQQYGEDEKELEDFKDIKITSCSVTDQKAKDLIEQCRRDALRAEEEMIENARRKKEKEQAPQEGILESLSERLQSENPFDDFKKHLDQALKEQQEKEREEKEKAKEEEDAKMEEGQDPEFLKQN